MMVYENVIVIFWM